MDDPATRHPASQVLTRIINQILDRLAPAMQELADHLEKLGIDLREASDHSTSGITTNHNRRPPPRLHHGTLLSTATTRPPSPPRVYRRRTP